MNEHTHLFGHRRIAFADIAGQALSPTSNSAAITFGPSLGIWPRKCLGVDR